MKNSIIIVGGGITGLTIAYLASLSNYKVTVLEANKEFGGLLNTFDISDTKLEFYYHHFFTHDKEIHWLINELGLNDKLLYKKTSMGVYRNDNIFKFNGIIDLIKAFLSNSIILFTHKIKLRKYNSYIKLIIE